MPQSLSNILVHLVFSTKNRQPIIVARDADELWKYLGSTCSAHQCVPQRIGGTADHVHILCRLARTICVSDLIEEVKTGSSKWMKARDVPEFSWQSGYGAFSIGQSQLDGTLAYIDGQAEHHRRLTFQEEYREFLKKYHVEYDERYVWD
jgi:putative transposase